MISKDQLQNKKTLFVVFSMAAVCLSAMFTVNQPKTSVYMAMLVGLALLVALGIILFWRDKLNYQRLILVLLAAGIILRVGYALYTPCFIRQHDVGLADGRGGHADYILYIANHLSLPDTNALWQYYHPPLHHILAGILVRIQFACGLSAQSALENVQLLTAFYSCAAMVVCLNIFKELGLSHRATALGLALICFHPTFIILAGSINNDMLMILMYLAVLLYAIRWYKQPVMKNMLLAGLFLGLSMMSKISAVMLAPVLSFVFFFKLWTCRDQAKNLFLQALAFCGVSVPLGMWYPIRNGLRFGQEILFIPSVSAESQYVGGYGLADRLWRIPWSQLKSLYQDFTVGYNIPLSVLKTSVFGEWSYKNLRINTLLFYLGALLAVLSVVAMIRVVCTLKKRGQRIPFCTLALTWALLLLSYTTFCFRYPSVCTQDFRYIVPTLMIGAAFIGVLTDDLRQEKRLQKALCYGITVMSGAFCLCSAVFFVTLGKA